MKRYLSRATGGEAVTPLMLLFALNAVDELDRTAFGVLLPEIRDAFGTTNQGILSVVAVVAVLALGFQPVVGYYADRTSRVRLAAVGATLWALFSALTGLAPLLVVLVLARGGSAIGKLVNDPTHHALLADYYPPQSRHVVYGLYRAANAVGQAVGPLTAGLLAFYFGWRAPFLVFAVPTLIVVVLAVRRLREPVRGAHERRAMGASEETIATEEVPPSFGEAWRTCYQIRTLRRVWYSLPFLAAAVVGMASLVSLYYDEVFGLNEAHRGVIGTVAEPFQLLGIFVAIPIMSRVAARDPGRVPRLLGVGGVILTASVAAFALAPSVGVAIAVHLIVSAVIGLLTPGILAVSSLVIPPRARSMGFAIGSLYVMPGVLILVVLGGVADNEGVRLAMLVLAPVLLIGSLILGSAGAFVGADIQRVRSSTTAQAEVLAARRRGDAKLLLVRDLDVAYDGVQVLFGVDFEVDEGEIVALLGTNGAGKSTLLRAISGLVPASGGAVVFDGQDTTFVPPHEVAARGVVQVPGGKGVFPTLTVEENLRVAGWLFQREADYLRQATDEALGFFPVLRERWTQPAGNLSGGEQQMLTLAQAFIARPRLLMIDELSLGLAPAVVERLLDIVRAIRARGTTVILVEQSVNVALTLAETAYFMEKGEIRFHGPTAELLQRPDVLRSVFLQGAAAAGNGSNGSARKADAAPKRRRAATGGEPVLQATGVSVHFGGIRAVNDVSLSVAPGEILGIIGPNGAGKTTLFDLISGFLAPDEGRIHLRGVDVTDRSADQRSIMGLGRSFQDARLFGGLTVAETVAVALERHIEVRDPLAAALHLPAVADDEARTSRRVDDLIDVMGLGAFANKFVAELSTGSRRIVDLACVVAHDPSVILFDEPSSGIAQRETEALGPLLQRLRDNTGAALVVIEHDMPLVTSIADRMVALELGRVIADGLPEEVVEHPAVVASYLGSDEAAIARSGVLPAPTLAGTGRRRTRKR